ncbi:hypothetical protein [Novosphingobium lentum]|uniref:hypothetical protein n=1 Tax=Novosphingobium lentum TaxID=145287 RepID=UPI00082A91A6|nr:hypothetical protein [Novosphingobium lentum]
MKLAIAVVALVLAASPLAAQDAADSWERGADPVTLTNGLHAGDVFVTCSEHSGYVRVSVPASAARPVGVSVGAVRAVSREDAFDQGRARGWFEAGDPVWAAALADGGLTVDGQRIAFTSERDKRYFALTMRVCAAS